MAFFAIFWAFVIDQMYSDSNVCMPGCFDSYKCHNKSLQQFQYVDFSTYQNTKKWNNTISEQYIRIYQEVTNMGIMKNIAQSEVLKLKDQVAYQEIGRAHV